MRVFIYKLTHLGDPRSEGIWGVEDCMGPKRESVFDAVLGIGGIGMSEDCTPDPCLNGINADIRKKIIWIGIGPHRVKIEESIRRTDRRFADAVWFDHFLFYGQNGEKITPENYPELHKYAYETGKTQNLGYIDIPEHPHPGSIEAEVSEIISAAIVAPQSDITDEKRINEICRTLANQYHVRNATEAARTIANPTPANNLTYQKTDNIINKSKQE